MLPPFLYLLRTIYEVGRVNSDNYFRNFSNIGSQKKLTTKFISYAKNIKENIIENFKGHGSMVIDYGTVGNQ